LMIIKELRSVTHLVPVKPSRQLHNAIDSPNKTFLQLHAFNIILKTYLQ
jgi:hypothetical protein